MNHWTEEQIIEWALDRQAGKTADPAAASHLDKCSTCRATSQRWERVLQAMAKDRSPEPPVLWVERAIAAFGRDSILERARAFARGFREHAGRLLFDSSVPGALAAAGVRHVGLGRRLRFESGSIELDLQLEREGRSLQLVGQLVTLADEVAPLAGARLLVTSGQQVHELSTDELGEFALTTDGDSGIVVRVAHQDRIEVFEIPDVWTSPE